MFAPLSQTKKPKNMMRMLRSTWARVALPSFLFSRASSSTKSAPPATGTKPVKSTIFISNFKSIFDREFLPISNFISGEEITKSTTTETRTNITANLKATLDDFLSDFSSSASTAAKSKVCKNSLIYYFYLILSS